MRVSSREKPSSRILYLTIVARQFLTFHFLANRTSAYLISRSQTALGKINTSYIERLNATFRARMPALLRRTRGLARTMQRLETEMFWSGTVYHFCTVHSSFDATPGMITGLTDHICSVDELLRLQFPQKPLHPIV